MDEARLRSICKSTGWLLSWDNDYFSEDRFSDDIIYDLISEQNFGFTLDWKYDASDILWGLNRCLLLDVTIRKETSTFSSLKPFNQVEERYRTVTLVKGGQEKTIIYSTSVDEDAGFLAQQIMSFAGISDKKVVDISTRGDDSYAFIVVNNGVTRYDLEPFEFHEIATKSSAEALAFVAKQAPYKYFFIPVFTNNVAEIPGDNRAASLNVLTYKNGDVYQTDYYASRVLPGQTLIEAVKHDLAQDFKYDGEFEICDYRILDTATDKQGNKLPRLLVNVDAGYFNTDGLRVLDTEVMWRAYELADFARRLKLGFDLQDEVMREEDAHEVIAEDNELLADSEIRAILEEYDLLDDEYDTKRDVFNTLDEIANDWLLNDLSEAEIKDLAEVDPGVRGSAPNANVVKAKIYGIELKMQELNPEYKPSIYDQMKVSDWNSPREASLENFYKEFAYYFGDEESKIDEAASVYIKLHPEADIEDVKKTMSALS